MTRKDYVLIARVFNRTRPPATHPEQYKQWRQDVNAMALELASFNARFDAERFVADCCKI